MISLEIVDTSQGDRTIIVPSPWGYRRMTVRCPHEFFWALQRHRAVTLRAPYDYRKSLRSFLGQDDNLKPCVVLTITMRRLPGRVAQSVTCLATDANLTADPGREFDPGPVPYFRGD